MKLQKTKIKIAKLLDEYMGKVIILCYLLFQRTRKKELPLQKVRKILFIKFWGIGSIILSEPALRWLRKTYPEAEIHYLTLAQNKPLFDLIPLVKRIHVLPFTNPLIFLFNSLLLIRSLRKEKYELIFDGEFFVNFSALLAQWAGANRVLGFARNNGIRKYLLDSSVPFLNEIHTSKQFLNLVQNNSASKELQFRPRLYLNENGFLNGKLGLGNKPYIVININASALATERRWHRERFVHLAKALLNAYEFDLLLIGSKAEESYVIPLEMALGNSSRVKNLAGQLSLSELAHVLKNAALFISNDSGPIHMASALNIPVVGFYGPETPKRYGPLSAKKLVFYQNLWCSPCMSVDNAKTVNCINHLACMKEIETHHVIRQVIKFIDKEILKKSLNIKQRS
jgi:heptosyltransferase-2